MEDEEKSEYKESESISNQRNILMQYLEQNNLALEEEYVDDGVSSTSFDRPAAMIVREIFESYLNGKGTTQIANDLSSRGIAILSVHKQINRGNKSMKYGLWCNRTVKHILENETYTGCLIQNKYNKLNYKSKKTIITTQDKWIKVENTQEPIIDKEVWERVQTLLIRNNNSRISRHDYILSGLLRCYECKSAIGISKKDDRGYSYGRCQK